MNKIYIFFLVLGVCSCNSFLDETPDMRTEINTPEKIQELLATAYPDATYFAVAEAMSDNSGFRVNSNNEQRLTELAYHWEDNNDIIRDTPTFYWMAAYRAIAAANQALESVSELTQDNELDYLKGEALVARAYNHFTLGVLWCKPYNISTASSDLGLPYVTKVEKRPFESYTRISLEDFYKNIENDLIKGINLIQNSKYKQPKFHFTKEAANAFATRFYLSKGEWNKVLQHANTFANLEIANNLRDLTTSFKSMTYSQRLAHYSSSSEKANLLISGCSSLYSNSRDLFYAKYGLSADISDKLISQARHPLGLRWAYTFYGGDDNSYNFPKIIEYFKYNNISAGIGYPYAMVTLFSYDEVLLNKMEANVMLGNYDQVVEDLNLYLPKKTEGTITSPLTKTMMDTKYNGQGLEFSPNYPLTDTQRGWIKCITDLRQVEFYHEGLRWFDNKRLGMKITHTSARGVFELEKEDLRRELQIPQDAIENGIVKNPR